LGYAEGRVPSAATRSEFRVVTAEEHEQLALAIERRREQQTK
jgi:hypothetical protein